MVIIHEPVDVADHLDRYGAARGIPHSVAFYEQVECGDLLMRELQAIESYIMRNRRPDGFFKADTPLKKKRLTYLSNIARILEMNKHDYELTPEDEKLEKLTPKLRGRFVRRNLTIKQRDWQRWMKKARQEKMSAREWATRRIWVSIAVLHTVNELRRMITNAILNKTIRKDMETYAMLQEFVRDVDKITSQVWGSAFDDLQEAQASFLGSFVKNGPLAEIPSQANRDRPKPTNQRRSGGC